MRDHKFGFPRRQVGVVLASALSVVAVVAVSVLVAHPWRGATAHRPVADTTGSAVVSGSPSATATDSLPAGAVSGVLSASPTPSPTASDSPPAPTATTPQATAPAGDDKINFEVSVQVTPTQAVVGQKVRVTVTVVNKGGVFDRPVEMFFQGSDPSDDVSDPPPHCTANQAITCPITGIRPGSHWLFTFNFIPGVFPATDHFDDDVYAAFDYTDGHGQGQQTPMYYAQVRVFNKPLPPSPSGSGSPSDTPSPSEPSAAASSTTPVRTSSTP